MSGSARLIRWDRNDPSYAKTLNSQSVIDEEISSLLKVVFVLRTRRNCFSAISRLPPEIMGRIFRFSMDCPALHIPKFIGVCRAWYEIALNDPNMWTCVNARSSQGTIAQVLKRSKRAPLDVYISYTRSTATWESILAELPRTRYLEMSFGDEILPRTALTVAAPLLEVASISHKPSNNYTNAQLPDGVFGLNTPKLRHLTLWRVCLDWRHLTKPDFVSQLRELEIYLLPSRTPPTLRQILEMLSLTRHLVVLKLSGALPTGELGTPCASDAVNLTRLLYLKLDGALGDIEHLLPHLSVPPETAIDFSLPNGRSSSASNLLRFIAEHQARLRTTPIRRLRLSNAYSSYAVEAFPHEATSHDITIAVPDALIRASVHTALTPLRAIPELFTSICCALACEHVHSLELHDINVTPSTAPLYGLDRAINVSSIVVTRSSARGVIEILTLLRRPDRTSGLANTSDGALFPALQRLDLESVDFDSLSADGNFKMLKTCLEQRRNLAVDITAGRNIGSEEIEALGQVVEKAEQIFWDEYTDWDEDSEPPEPNIWDLDSD